MISKRSSNSLAATPVTMKKLIRTMSPALLASSSRLPPTERSRAASNDVLAKVLYNAGSLESVAANTPSSNLPAGRYQRDDCESPYPRESQIAESPQNAVREILIEGIAALTDVNITQAANALDEADGNPQKAISYLEDGHRRTLRHCNVCLCFVYSIVFIILISTFLQEYSAVNGKQESRQSWEPLRDNPVSLPVWAFRLTSELFEVFEVHYQGIIRNGQPSELFCSPNITQTYFYGCHAHQYDFLVCEDGSYTPANCTYEGAAMDFLADPPPQYNVEDFDCVGVEYEKPEDMRWSYCGELGVARERCPSSWPAMVAKEGSAYYGDDYGCFNIFSSTRTSNGGSRICPDGREPDLQNSSCTDFITWKNQTDLFFLEENRLKHVRTLGNNVLIVTPPDRMIYDDEDVYTVAFRYNYMRAYDIWLQDRDFQPDQREFFEFVDAGNRTKEEIQAAARTMITFHGHFQRLNTESIEGKSMNEIQIYMEGNDENYWTQGQLVEADIIATIHKQLDGTSEESEMSLRSTETSYVNYAVNFQYHLTNDELWVNEDYEVQISDLTVLVTLGGILAVLWSSHRLITHLMNRKIICNCERCGRDKQTKIWGFRPMDLDCRTRKSLQWYLYFFDNPDLDRAMAIQALSSKLQAPEKQEMLNELESLELARWMRHKCDNEDLVNLQDSSSLRIQQETLRIQQMESFAMLPD